VNTTIFSEIEEVKALVNAMVTELENLRVQYCGADPGVVPTPPSDGPSCEWEEYEQTKEYLGKTDDVIQELFKGDESARLNTLLAFVEVQGLFDKRVKKLFEDELMCPEEAAQIKEKYMGQLSKCMADFMKPSTDFNSLSRIQRIRCTKELRNLMETRMGELLSLEVDKSLDGIIEGSS
jgi:hypothetical protein